MTQSNLKDFDPADVDDVRQSVVHPYSPYDLALRELYNHIRLCTKTGVPIVSERYRQLSANVYQLSDDENDFQTTIKIVNALAANDAVTSPGSAAPTHTRPGAGQTFAIGCAFPGCHQTVIGQCAGYRDACGRYYCADHSQGTLCSECAQKKETEELTAANQADTIETIERIRQQASRQAWKPVLLAWPVLLVVISAIIILVVTALTRTRTLADPSGLLGGAIVALYCGVPISIVATWLYRIVKVNALAREQAIRADEQKPGLLKAYDDWRHKRNREALKVGSQVAAGALAGVASIINDEVKKSERDARMRDAVDHGVDDALKRRGL